MKEQIAAEEDRNILEILESTCPRCYGIRKNIEHTA
jgi:hypothetical protein